MACVFGNHLVVEVDTVTVLAEALVEAFEIFGIGGNLMAGFENITVVAAEIGPQYLKMDRIGSRNAFPLEIYIFEIAGIKRWYRLPDLPGG